MSNLLAARISAVAQDYRKQNPSAASCLYIQQAGDSCDQQVWQAAADFLVHSLGQYYKNAAMFSGAAPLLGMTVTYQ
jgi:hypothetical protein